MQSKSGNNPVHLYLFVLIRILIGWHFLYEGVTKVIAENWSSASYLAGSKWIFAPVFHWMAGYSGIISVVDFLNTCRWKLSLGK